MEYFTLLSNTFELRGFIHENSQRNENPIVIIIHGYFSSNKVGPNRLYFQLAECLKQVGYTVIRCDLRGMGDSEGDIKNVLFEDHVQDVNNIVIYVKKRFQKKIILVGHSFGCLTSINCLLDNPLLFEKAIFLSPIYSSEMTLLNFFKDYNVISELKSIGYTYRKGYYVNYTFFNNVLNIDNISKKLRKIRLPLEIVIGSKDQFVNMSEFNLFCNKSNVKPKYINNGDHNYLNNDSRKLLFIEIINYIIH